MAVTLIYSKIVNIFKIRARNLHFEEDKLVTQNIKPLWIWRNGGIRLFLRQEIKT